ncbi:Smr/MutS family protein [Caulobacter sp. LARHSG274]
MKRPPRQDEMRLWGMVTATVKAKPTRKAAGWTAKAEKSLVQPTTLQPMAPLLVDPKSIKPAHAQRPAGPLEGIEPNRKRKIVREHTPLAARLDLHGLDQDRARPMLEAFLRRAWEDGHRAALVITGKGKVGMGVLRTRTPEWLAGPALRDIVAGVSPADKRHGGDGALYVALKRRPPKI